MSINTKMYISLVAEHKKMSEDEERYDDKSLKQDYEFFIKYENELLRKIKTEEIKLNGRNYLREQMIQRDKEEIQKSLQEKKDLLDLITYGVGYTHLRKIQRLNHDNEMIRAANRGTIADRYMTKQDIEKIIE